MQKSHTAKALEIRPQNKIKSVKQLPFPCQENRTARLFLGPLIQQARFQESEVTRMLSRHRQHQKQLGEAIRAQGKIEQNSIVRLMQADALVNKLSGLHHRVRDLRWLTAEISTLLKQYQREAEQMYAPGSYKYLKSASILKEFEVYEARLKQLDSAQLQSLPPAIQGRARGRTSLPAKAQTKLRVSRIKDSIDSRQTQKQNKNRQANEKIKQELSQAKARLELLQNQKNRLQSQIAILRDSQYLKQIVEQALFRGPSGCETCQKDDFGVKRLVLEAELQRLSSRRQQLLQQNESIQNFIQETSREFVKKKHDFAVFEPEELSALVVMQAKALETLLSRDPCD